jgi:hypothetical protein
MQPVMNGVAAPEQKIDSDEIAGVSRDHPSLMTATSPGLTTPALGVEARAREPRLVTRVAWRVRF